MQPLPESHVELGTSGIFKASSPHDHKKQLPRPFQVPGMGMAQQLVNGVLEYFGRPLMATRQQQRKAPCRFQKDPFLRKIAHQGACYIASQNSVHKRLVPLISTLATSLPERASRAIDLNGTRAHF